MHFPGFGDLSLQCRGVNCMWSKKNCWVFTPFTPAGGAKAQMIILPVNRWPQSLKKLDGDCWYWTTYGARASIVLHCFAETTAETSAMRNNCRSHTSLLQNQVSWTWICLCASWHGQSTYGPVHPGAASKVKIWKKAVGKADNSIKNLFDSQLLLVGYLANSIVTSSVKCM